MAAARIPRMRKLKLIVLSAALAVGALFLRYWLFPPGMGACATRVVARIAGPGRYDAEVSEQVCDGISSSDRMSLALVTHGGKREASFFIYGRKTADPTLSRKDVPPTVIWEGRNRLAISIDMVSDVEKKLSEASGVKIDYHIGAVEYR